VPCVAVTSPPVVRGFLFMRSVPIGCMDLRSSKAADSSILFSSTGAEMWSFTAADVMPPVAESFVLVPPLMLPTPTSSFHSQIINDGLLICITYKHMQIIIYIHMTKWNPEKKFITN